MKQNDKVSFLPTPVCLTLEEVNQVAGGAANIADFVQNAQFTLEHIIIGRPAITAIDQTHLAVPQVELGKIGAR